MEKEKLSTLKSNVSRVLESRRLLPLAIIALTFFIASVFISFGPTVEPIPIEEKLPSVEVQNIALQSFTLPIYSRGNVKPEQEITLSSEVVGAVTEISPHFVNGGYFKKGDWLVKVDPSHHEIEVANALAQLASAKLRLEQTKAQVRSGKNIEIDVKRKTQLAQGKPQLDDAQASYYAAQTALTIARQKLKRTTIKAPFDGRVLNKLVNTKEYLTTGKPIAQIYATNAAEVRLPLTTEQYQFINLSQTDFSPNSSSDEISSNQYPIVWLTDHNSQFEWQGKIVRSEGTIDQRNRLIYVVARIESPFSASPDYPDRPPLVPGTFVEAKIQGKSYDNIAVVPRRALHNLDEVRVVNEENRLSVRRVDVLYSGKNESYIRSGLNDDDQLILSPLDVVIENMKVNISNEVETVIDLQMEISPDDAVYEESIEDDIAPTSNEEEILSEADSEQAGALSEPVED